MRNNETGEFELVVGNRQLLSGFFIVVLLFAVAFAMGYVVGQNSPRSAKAETAAATSAVTEPRPQAAAAAAPPPPAAEPAPQPSDTAPAAQASAEAPPQPTTQPAREPEKAAPVNPDAAPVYADLPGPAGSFWQVIAVAEPDAQVIAGALKKKGFSAFLTPGPKGLMRVMVGPYSDSAAMGKAKTDLAAAGFPNPYRK
jgi:cell division septation protein DedD